MTRMPLGPYRYLTALAVLPTILTLGSAVAVAKPTTNAAAPDETPSAEPADSSSGTSTESTAAVTAATATSAAMETAEPINNEGLWRQFTRWLQSRPHAEPPAPPPPDVEPIPATGVPSGGAPATPAAYVQHLGPESFPGRLRGLYGGSLWLEPSFNGLQWPYMAHTGIGVSGNAWVDSGYEAIKRNPTFPNSNMYLQQGRGVLRVTPTYVHGRFFVQGQVELVGNLCQATNSGGPGPTPNTVCLSAGTFSTDDLWIRVGQWNIWDLKVGRFEGWEVYHLGMGMDQYTLERMGAGMFGISDTGTNPNQTSPAQLEAPSFYGVNYLHDRPTDGLAVGAIALHLYFTEYLRLELLGKLGTDNYRNDDRATGNPAATYLGGRPTAIFDVGWLKIKIGAEYQTRTPITQDSAGGGAYKDPVEQTVQKGIGGSVQFVIDPLIEFGLNGAAGRLEYTNSTGNAPGMPGYPGVLANSYTTKSVGGFANVRIFDLLMGGVGLNWTEQTDDYYASLNSGNAKTGAADYTSHLQGFAAVQYLLGGQLFIKAVFGYAKAYFQPSDPDAATWNTSMYSGRIRLMYLY